MLIEPSLISVGKINTKMSLQSIEVGRAKPQPKLIEDFNIAERTIFLERAYMRLNLALEMGRRGQLDWKEALELARGTSSRGAIEEDATTYDPDRPLGAESNYDNPTFRLVMLSLRLAQRINPQS